MIVIAFGSVPASAHTGRMPAGISLVNPGAGVANGDLHLAGNPGTGSPSVQDSTPPPPPPPPPPPGGPHGRMDSLRHVMDSLRHVRDSINHAILDSLHRLRDSSIHRGLDTLRRKHRDSLRLRDSIIHARRDSIIRMHRDTLHFIDSVRHRLRDSIIHSWLDSMRIRDSIIRARLDSLWHSDTTHHRRDSIGHHEARGTSDPAQGLPLTAVSVPTATSLAQNYPNPFNPTTQISFTLPAADAVTLAVYSSTGKQVATLLNEQLSAGLHTVTFNATNLPSGVYWYRLTTGSSSLVKRRLLTK